MRARWAEVNSGNGAVPDPDCTAARLTTCGYLQMLVMGVAATPSGAKPKAASIVCSTE